MNRWPGPGGFSKYVDRLYSPICLLLALAMFAAGFAVLASGPPAASVKLHDARAAGDQASTDALERGLRSKQLNHMILVVLLFGGALWMVVTAFLAMKAS